VWGCKFVNVFFFVFTNSRVEVARALVRVVSSLTNFNLFLLMYEHVLFISLLINAISIHLKKEKNEDCNFSNKVMIN
jgi:hypothetical protein